MTHGVAVTRVGFTSQLRVMAQEAPRSCKSPGDKVAIRPTNAFMIRMIFVIGPLAALELKPKTLEKDWAQMPVFIS